MACDINETLAKACENKFSCLPSLREFDVVLAQLMCEVKTALENGGGGGGAARAIYTDTYTDPNVAGLVPTDPTHGATFYQDPSITLYNQWNWSVSQQKWYQWSSPA